MATHQLICMDGDLDRDRTGPGSGSPRAVGDLVSLPAAGLKCSYCRDDIAPPNV